MATAYLGSTCPPLHQSPSEGLGDVERTLSEVTSYSESNFVSEEDKQSSSDEDKRIAQVAALPLHLNQK